MAEVIKHNRYPELGGPGRNLWLRRHIDQKLNVPAKGLQALCKAFGIT